MGSIILLWIAGAAPFVSGSGSVFWKTYESAAGGDFVLTSAEGPAMMTMDGTWDVGGVVITADQVPAGAYSASASVHDDLLVGIGGWLCTDNNADNIFCDQEIGEVAAPFCGNSGSVSLPVDQWDQIAVFVDGPVFQPVDCQGTANPLGGTSGSVRLNVAASGGVPSQRTIPFTVDVPAANDLHIEFSRAVEVVPDSVTGNAGPFRDWDGGTTNKHDYRNPKEGGGAGDPEGTVENGDTFEMKFRSDGAFQIDKWWWTLDGKQVGDEHGPKAKAPKKKK